MLLQGLILQSQNVIYQNQMRRNVRIIFRRIRRIHPFLEDGGGRLDAVLVAHLASKVDHVCPVHSQGQRVTLVLNVAKSLVLFVQKISHVFLKKGPCVNSQEEAQTIQNLYM